MNKKINYFDHEMDGADNFSFSAPASFFAATVAVLSAVIIASQSLALCEFYFIS